jgi:hypothetical protein
LAEEMHEIGREFRQRVKKMYHIPPEQRFALT